VLVADLAAGQRLFGAGQLLQLAGGVDPLGGGGPRELAVHSQPWHHAEEAVTLVAAGLLEPAGGLGPHRLRPVDDFPAGDDDLAKLPGRLLGNPAWQVSETRQDSLEWRLAGPAHATSVRHGCDSCLSYLQISLEIHAQIQAAHIGEN